MKSLRFLVLGLPLIFGGCDPTATIAQIQNLTVQTCGYLPAAESVAALIATQFGGGVIVGTVEQVAAAICAVATSVAPAPVVTPKALKRLAAKQVTVVVGGVPIKGHFVR